MDVFVQTYIVSGWLFFWYNFSNVELLFCCFYDIFAVPSLDWMSYKHFFSLVPSQALLKPAAPAFLDSLGRLDPEELQVELVSKASAVHALTWLVSVSTRSNMRFRIVVGALGHYQIYISPKIFQSWTFSNPSLSRNLLQGLLWLRLVLLTLWLCTARWPWWLRMPRRRHLRIGWFTRNPRRQRHPWLPGTEGRARWWGHTRLPWRTRRQCE